MQTLGAAILAGAAIGAALPAAGGAETAAELQRRADALRALNASLATGSQTAFTSLSAIEARLAQARAELASFRARAEHVRSRRRATVEELRIVRASLQASQDALAERLRMLYEQGETDVVAVILGSGSLDVALSTVETLDLAARQDESLVRKARASSRRLGALARALAARERELEQLAAARAAAAASLADARAEKLATLARLRAARNANSGEIATLWRRARTLAAAQVLSHPNVVPVVGGSAAGGVGALQVTATGYALRGTTASGTPVGWGVVAVDPSVIPIGSRLQIPGYGLAVASDTGGAIDGARIDLWFPSVAQARAWGRRVVTVTVYRR